MALTVCSIDGNDYHLEYQKDHSDNSHSGILNLRSPILFSYSDSLFIPAIDERHQVAIKNAIDSDEQTQQNNRA